MKRFVRGGSRWLVRLRTIVDLDSKSQSSGRLTKPLARWEVLERSRSSTQNLGDPGLSDRGTKLRPDEEISLGETCHLGNFVQTIFGEAGLEHQMFEPLATA